MPAKLWVIDVWGKLLYPMADRPDRREGERIFGRYGQLEVLRQGTELEQLVARAHAAEAQMAGIHSTDAAWGAESCAPYPGRFFGIVSPDSRNIMACLRSRERGAWRR